jgi:cytochrome c oxidase subunit II
MGGSVTVMGAGEFQQWLAANATGGTLATEGGALYRRLGCSGCHGGGGHIHGPPLAGLYGRSVALRSGETVIADDGFIRDAILEPQKRPPAGYAAIMPSFAGRVDEEQIASLLAYIKSLADRDTQQ